MIESLNQTEIKIKPSYSLTLSWFWINPLPDNKILDWSKFKQIADHILKYI